jgi:hypothetical protein
MNAAAESSMVETYNVLIVDAMNEGSREQESLRYGSCGERMRRPLYMRCAPKSSALRQFTPLMEAMLHGPFPLGAVGKNAHARMWE